LISSYAFMVIPMRNPTTKQRAIVNIQLNRPIVTYPGKFIRDMLLHSPYDFML